MSESPRPLKPYGTRSRGVSAMDVERAADQLLRTGERPTVEKIRAALGGGSPNTINPLLDSWWKRIGARVDAGPSALHRLPEAVAHIAEALWMQALDEGRQRAQIELGAEKRAVDSYRSAYEVRSHVLTLREGELDSRLRERERRNGELEAQLRTFATLLQKEQHTRESLSRRVAELEAEIHRLRKSKSPQARRPTPKHVATKKKSGATRAGKVPPARAARRLINNRPRTKKSRRG